MSYRGTISGFESGTAEPYFIRPGYAVKWHIDGERDNYYDTKTANSADKQGNAGDHHGEEEARDTMEYKTYDGIARSVIYNLMPAQSPNANRYPFSCTATIVLDLDYLPAKKMSDPADTITNELTDIANQHDSAFALKEKYDATSSSDSETSRKSKYVPIENIVITNMSSPSPTERAIMDSVPYIISYQKVTDGMRLKYECKWSDGSVTYIDATDQIPKYKPREDSNSTTSLFNLR